MPCQQGRQLPSFSKAVHAFEIANACSYCGHLLQHFNAFYNIVIVIVGGLILRYGGWPIIEN